MIHNMGIRKATNASLLVFGFCLSLFVSLIIHLSDGGGEIRHNDGEINRLLRIEGIIPPEKRS
jgi:hypothetical protein